MRCNPHLASDLDDLLPWEQHGARGLAGLLIPVPGFQFGRSLLTDLAQDGDHVRAHVPFVIEQDCCRVPHCGKLARMGVLHVPGSARPRHAVTPTSPGAAEDS